MVIKVKGVEDVVNGVGAFVCWCLHSAGVDGVLTPCQLGLLDRVVYA